MFRRNSRIWLKGLVCKASVTRLIKPDDITTNLKKRLFISTGLFIDWTLQTVFAAELDFLKILVLRLPQNSSNVNTECAGIILHFIFLILMFLIDYAYFKLRNMRLLLFDSNSRSYHCTVVSHWRKNIVANITQDRW